MGVLAAVIDNIPVMFAVLSMNPEMGLDQWLLVILVAGVDGSLLSIGSAADVALMEQARGIYTFFSHLKWRWAIAMGYVASILTRLCINTPGAWKTSSILPLGRYKLERNPFTNQEWIINNEECWNIACGA